ncbi:hypothetical protein J6590_036789 [Homalodisca vitripennis]|nr:hypothetical protein J6590_036789 [Homalodisca vitripennis]
MKLDTNCTGNKGRVVYYNLRLVIDCEQRQNTTLTDTGVISCSERDNQTGYHVNKTIWWGARTRVRGDPPLLSSKPSVPPTRWTFLEFGKGISLNKRIASASVGLVDVEMGVYQRL